MNEYIFCKYNPEQEDEYGWAICKCSPSLCYGIRIKRKKEDHFFSFKCPNCGEQLGMFLRGTDHIS